MPGLDMGVLSPLDFRHSYANQFLSCIPRMVPRMIYLAVFHP